MDDMKHEAAAPEATVSYCSKKVDLDDTAHEVAGNTTETLCAFASMASTMVDLMDSEVLPHSPEEYTFLEDGVSYLHDLVVTMHTKVASRCDCNNSELAPP